MKALLVASGDAPDDALLRDRTKEADILIAVDNGLEAFDRCSIVPDLIVGDMDSVSKKMLEVYGDRVELCAVPAEKNETDTALAIDEAVKRGADRIVLLGATGGRIDHLLSNLMLLKYAYNKGAALLIEDDCQEIFLSNGETELHGKKGQTVSLIPMNTRAVVNAEGLYYPLENLLLTNEKPRGVSNVFLGDSARIISDDFIFVIKIKG